MTLIIYGSFGRSVYYGEINTVRERYDIDVIMREFDDYINGDVENHRVSNIFKTKEIVSERSERISLF